MAEATAARSAQGNDGGDSSTLKDSVSNVTENVKGKVSELGQRLNDTIEEQREATASNLRTAATTLYTEAERLPGDTMKSLAQGAAEKIDQTSTYIRQHNARAVLEDVTQVVRRYPGRTIVVSLAVGFLLGHLFTSE